MITDLYVIMHNYMPFCQEEVGEKMIFFMKYSKKIMTFPIGTYKINEWCFNI